MHSFRIIIFLTLISCSSNRIGIIRYEEINHADFVDQAIARTGVRFIPSEDGTSGKGILAITPKDSISVTSDSIFTLVSVNRLSSKSLTIINEVPTSEGMFVLTTQVDNDKQKTTFTILDWPTKTVFKTTFSRLTLAVKPNNLGITSGKIEYKGKSDHGQQEITLVDHFYFE